MHFLWISVDELWLKGKNRKSYYSLIIKHINWLLRELHGEVIPRGESLLVRVDDLVSARQRLQLVAGIKSIYTAFPLVDIVEDSVKIVTGRNWQGTFRVSVKRVDKSYALTAPQLAALLGEKILQKNASLKVKLKNYDYHILVKIYPQSSFLLLDKEEGMGGLPVGSSGHMLSLISGGLDSPVASYLMNRRGVRLSYLFFYSYPFVGEEVLDKIKSIVALLSRWQIKTNLYVANIAKLQETINKHADERYRTVILRVAMNRIAALVAARIGAIGLVTGDCLGQVASQTVDNLVMIDKNSPVFIARPLLAMTKEEIISYSRKIGCYNYSTIRVDDACSLFASDRPILVAKDDIINKFFDQKLLDFNQIVDDIDNYSFSDHFCTM